MDDRPLSRSQRAAVWRDAIDLSLSWLRYGDERQKRLQAEARGSPEAQGFELLMIADVFARVASGELQAIGYRLAPAPSDGPVMIPADLFEGRPGENVMEGELRIGVEVFDRVRIMEASGAIPDSDVAEFPPHDPVAEAAEPIRAVRRRPGPESGGTALRAIYRELVDTGALAPKHTRVEAHNQVSKVAEQRRPDLFKGGRGLSYKSFCRHLDAPEV